MLLRKEETDLWHFHDDYPFQPNKIEKDHLEADHVFQIRFVLQSRLEIIINKVKKKLSQAGADPKKFFLTKNVSIFRWTAKVILLSINFFISNKYKA